MKKLAHFSLTALAIAFSVSAFAGTCPSDKVGDNALANAPTMPIGVTEMEISSIDLSAENVKLDVHPAPFRLRITMSGCEE